METPLTILNRYWGHNQFRPTQEDIITSILNGHDTLALLPTGGGKSICFQVPTLLLEGLAVVITPLIALMKDQVEQLRRRGIEAVAIHSGMSRREIDILLDNCVFGPVKFLYISPERLHTEIFTERVKRMKVAMIVIDEAHCISQWGYDFRPSYLQVGVLRTLKPGVPVMALTATATEQVCEDIKEKLAFGKEAGVYRRSFARENVSLVVRKTENKERKLLEVLQKVKGPAILYVRSRKATQDIASWLTRRNISASFYHAGLDVDDRTRRQDEWIKNKTRVMVATNAFGMGIDKPDVRVVIHLDLPENIEAYYQEAGRAGRDGQRAFATIIYNEADAIALRQKTEQAHPTPEVIKKVYQALANYYQLALGSAAGESFNFDLPDFSNRFSIPAPEAFSAMRKLEEEGFIQFNESFYSPSHMCFAVDRTKLYEFQIANARFDPVVKMMLRVYGGELFSGFVRVSEMQMARALQVNYNEMVSILNHLNAMQVIVYEPVKDKPQVTFLMPRQDAERLPLNIRRLEERKRLVIGKMQAMLDYADETVRCRMQVIQEYFNDPLATACGICDVCLTRKKEEDRSELDQLQNEILAVIKQQPLPVEELEERIAPRDREQFVELVRELVDAGMLRYDEAWKLNRSAR